MYSIRTWPWADRLLEQVLFFAFSFPFSHHCLHLQWVKKEIHDCPHLSIHSHPSSLPSFCNKERVPWLPFSSSTSTYFPSSLTSWLNLFFIIFLHSHHHHMSPVTVLNSGGLVVSLFSLHPLLTSSSKQQAVIDFNLGVHLCSRGIIIVGIYNEETSCAPKAVNREDKRSRR